MKGANRQKLVRTAAKATLARMGKAQAAAAWTVYILRCGDGSLYTGATNDLPRRYALHQRGAGGAYTRSRLPVALVYSEPALDRGAAYRREAALKRLRRGAKMRLLQKGQRQAAG
jgi:putative endonuclease